MAMVEPNWRTGANARINRKREWSKRPIPGGITLDDFRQIQDFLEQMFREIESSIGNVKDEHRPRELHMRLNESDKPWPLPIFVGWYEAASEKIEDNERMQFNHPHPALWRFGDDVLSEVYAEAINFADEVDDAAFQFRDWTGEMGEKRAGERATDPKAGNLFQTCRAIVINNEAPQMVPPGPTEEKTFRRAVGTLVLGFRQRPHPDSDVLKKAHQILNAWAVEKDGNKDPRGKLIEWLKGQYELGGPLLRATPNTFDNRWLNRR
jgi:hypothetical protein